MMYRVVFSCTSTKSTAVKQPFFKPCLISAIDAFSSLTDMMLHGGLRQKMPRRSKGDDDNVRIPKDTAVTHKGCENEDGLVNYEALCLKSLRTERDCLDVK